MRRYESEGVVVGGSTAVFGGVWGVELAIWATIGGSITSQAVVAMCSGV